MSKSIDNIDTPVPTYVEIENGSSSFIDNRAVTVKNQRVYQRASKPSYGRYARGGLSILKIIALALFVIIFFSAMFGDFIPSSWSTARFLTILSKAPSISDGVKKAALHGLDFFTLKETGVEIVDIFVRLINFPVRLLGLLQYVGILAYEGYAFIAYMFSNFFFFA